MTTSKTTHPSRSLIAQVVTINRPARELYDFWRDPTNLADFMDNVESIEKIDEQRARWTAKGPAGHSVSWISVITKEVPGEEIYWQSAEGADVANSGRIRFEDAGDRGTVVRATIAYDPPAGFVGKIIAKLFQREPSIQARRDLRRFKQLMETGEVATSSWTRQQLAEEKA